MDNMINVIQGSIDTASQIPAEPVDTRHGLEIFADKPIEEHILHVKEKMLFAIMRLTTYTDHVFNRSVEVLSKNLIEVYSNSSRTYHNIKHISVMLKGVEAVPDLTGAEEAALLLAVLYHDIQYTCDKNYINNEPLSAYKFLKDSVLLGLKDSIQQQVYMMILNTWYSYKIKPLDKLSEFLIDLDFMGLGFSYDYHSKTSENIQQEFAKMMPEFDQLIFIEKRIEFLENLLTKKLFYTSEFSLSFEENAKNNIKQEIEELKYKHTSLTKLSELS